jgi:hypothetical protein
MIDNIAAINLKLGMVVFTNNITCPGLICSTVVTRLDLIGDDVEINGGIITTSKGNLISTLRTD